MPIILIESPTPLCTYAPLYGSPLQFLWILMNTSSSKIQFMMVYDLRFVEFARISLHKQAFIFVIEFYNRQPFLAGQKNQVP
jgi:hypothetical protein